MRRSSQGALLAVLLIVVAAAGGAAWWFGPADTSAAAGVSLDRDVSLTPAPAGDTPLEPATPRTEAAGVAATTVVWPLEVELSLVQRGTFEVPENAAPIGSGATASMRGSVFSADGSGLRATVTFDAGPNEGRVLTCDDDGAYGASDLYGGLNVVTIRTPSGRTAQREVLLREFTETPLTIGFGRPAAIYGRVLDQAGEPIQGASVTVDGTEALTDPEGVFHFPAVASGRVLAIVRKPGYATYREIIPVTAGFVITQEKLTFTLERGASLAVSILEQVGGRGPAHVYLIPTGGQRVNTVRGQRTFPWYLVNPVEVYPGGTTVVEDLPPGRVDLVLCHSGAVAKPPRSSIKLSPGREKAQVLHLEPGPVITGSVTREGQGVADVRVTLEAPHRTRATTDFLGKRYDFMHDIVMAHVTPARQVVRTDPSGRFTLTAFDTGAKAWYLAAETADGGWFSTRTIGPGADEVELELQPAQAQTGRLEVVLDGRFQGLPVHVRVNGTPREKLELPPGESLMLSDLEPGTWRLDVAWNGKYLEKGHSLEIGAGMVGVEVDLPDGAIEGQNEFERRRAGKGS